MSHSAGKNNKLKNLIRIADFFSLSKSLLFLSSQKDHHKQNDTISNFFLHLIGILHLSKLTKNLQLNTASPTQHQSAQNPSPEAAKQTHNAIEDDSQSVQHMWHQLTTNLPVFHTLFSVNIAPNAAVQYKKSELTPSK